MIPLDDVSVGDDDRVTIPYGRDRLEGAPRYDRDRTELTGQDEERIYNHFGLKLRVTGIVAGKLGILERYGVGTRGSGGPGQAKVHGHPVIPWDRVVRVGSEIVVRDESDQQTTMDFT